MHLILFCTLLSSIALAQVPEKENNLGSLPSLNLFIIEDVEQGKIFWLERTGDFDHLLHMTNEGDLKKLQKIASKEASKLDQDFSARFLKIQYELPVSEAECKASWRLTLKGEQIEVCKKDDLKSQEILPFVKNLEKHLL